MKFRHEIKHEITYRDMLILRSRLSHIAKCDAHTKDGKYHIRSLYFDNQNDKALKEKQDGVNIREKFRIRLYNNDTDFIKLEKKSKINGLCLKESTRLSYEQVEKISNGDYSWMIDSGDKLIIEFYTKIKTQGLKAKTVVDYDREPFIFPAGNVRVTLDYNIRTGIGCTDFLKSDMITVETDNSAIILEVKWDEFLPDIIRDAVGLGNCRSGAFSKYAVCRKYD